MNNNSPATHKCSPQQLLCQTCNNPVNKSHTDDTGTQFYNCPKCGSITKTMPITVPQEKTTCNKENITILEHINNIENPKLTGKPVELEAVISSTSISYTVPAKVKAVLKEEDQDNAEITPEIPIDNPVNISLIAVTQEAQNNRLVKFLKQKYPTEAKVSIISQLSHRTVYLVRVRPQVFTLEKQDDRLVDDKGYEYKHLDLYVVSDIQLNFQPSTLIRITGLPLPNPKTQKTTFLAYNVEFPEDNLNYDLQKIKRLSELFAGKSVLKRLQWILDNFECYSRIFNRGNIATAAFLMYFTPLQVHFNGDRQRGWGISVVVGDTTTGKSETVKKMSKLFNAGLVISAETASTVGLTGAATQTDRDGWFIDWGFLPLMNRKLLAIDGAHKLSASSWAALAEAERSGVLSIAKAAKNNTYARTRQIKIYNPVDKEADRYSTKSLGSFLHPVQSLTTILDPTSIARIDLCVFSDQRVVTPDLINKKVIDQPDPELGYLSEILKWAWSCKAKVEWEDAAVSLLLQKATELYNMFFLEAIPLVSIDVKFKIARLSVALAHGTLSTNNDYSVVVVTDEHVQVVVDFLTEEYNNAGLGILAQERKFEKLTHEVVVELIQRIQTQLAKNSIENLTDILRFIVNQNHTTSSELKTKFDLTENNQARPLIATLKTEGLLTSKNGYYPTSKLIEAYKVTEGFTNIQNFNGVNELNRVKKTPLSSDLLCKEQKTLQNDDRGLNSNGVKTVSLVKTVIQQLPLLSSRVCGDCARFHTEFCQHPSLAAGGDSKLMKTDSAWACECIGWLESESKGENL